MGNFEKLSVLVIVVIIVMILVVALYTWTDNPDDGAPAANNRVSDVRGGGQDVSPPPARDTIDDWDRRFRGGDPQPPKVDVPQIPEPPTPLPLPEPDPQPKVQPEPEPEPEPSAEAWMYTVKDGDTLTEIAQRELSTWKRYKEILALNPGLDPNALRKGQVIKMPPRKLVAPIGPAVEPGPSPDKPKATMGSIGTGDWYVIRSGDRLSRISKRAYGTIDRWPELWARNLSVIDDPDAPPVGAKIFIPK